MKYGISVLALLAGLGVTLPANAQVPIQVVVPAGTQMNPAGFYTIFSNPADGIWFGDHFNGILHYALNPDGTYSIDLTLGWTVEGINGSQFAEFNYMGQLSRVSDSLALLAVPDTGKGSDGKPIGGVWTVAFDPGAQPGITPVGPLTHLVPDKGLAGPQATSVALGPDLKPYVGFLKNGNLVRINGANIESVGGTAGPPILSQAFNLNDDYLGAGDGFYVLTNAPACSGNQNNCGKPTLLASGATVAVANDNAGHIYFAQSTGVVRRYNLADGTITNVKSGLSFGSITAGLGFDSAGNLLIGELSEVVRISASDLATLP